MTTKVNCPKCHERFLLVDGGVVSNPSSIAGDTEVMCDACGFPVRPDPLNAAAGATGGERQ